MTMASNMVTAKPTLASTTNITVHERSVNAHVGDSS